MPTALETAGGTVWGKKVNIKTKTLTFRKQTETITASIFSREGAVNQWHEFNIRSSSLGEALGA